MTTTEPRTPPAQAGTGTVTVTEEEIARFVVARFLPGVDVAELEPDYDLLATAVIDSLGLLRIASWLEKTHGVVIPDRELTGPRFRSVRAIHETAARAAATGTRS
ncbi:acyl carrier protein [Streptomyces sp. NPDC085479]|uniref:acyl carrier protein n=1 Tax=Streptomyces sp. NPDC085479 TaxID=3365726 RepID=UPI0037D05D2C